jgi:hypothetical protein
MDTQWKQWKREVERLWSAPSFDYRQAAAITAEIARRGEEQSLKEATSQALPALRGACLKNADQMGKDLARRRFGAIRDALHVLDAPRFGKRGAAPAMPTPELHYRSLLGLPLQRRLDGTEIQQAYKRAAKRLHPDAGGSEGEFTELSAARDALMKQR